MKLNFVVFVKNSPALLDFMEYLHCNPSHFARFNVYPLGHFVVIFVYEGDNEVLTNAVRVGSVVIPHQEVKDNA